MYCSAGKSGALRSVIFKLSCPTVDHSITLRVFLNSFNRWANSDATNKFFISWALWTQSKARCKSNPTLKLISFNCTVSVWYRICPNFHDKNTGNNIENFPPFPPPAQHCILKEHFNILFSLVSLMSVNWQLDGWQLSVMAWKPPPAAATLHLAWENLDRL